MTDYVYGLNKSGESVVKLLQKKKQKFDCWDDDKKIRNLLKKKFPSIKFTQINKSNYKNYKNLFLTPGLSFFDKKFKGFSKLNIKRDLNLYYQNLQNEKIIAITGTNGKSTTTKLIGDLLIKKYKNIFVGGNIGEPLCNSLITVQKYSHHVIELSSFQLEAIENFNPKVSILLNLSNDHLDRYNNLKNYISAKKNIFSFGDKDINIISLDDRFSNKIFNDSSIKNKISFSIKDTNANIFYKKGYIIDSYFYKNKKFKLSDISIDLQNNYNLQNILATYIVCRFLKIPIKFFNYSIKKFKGLPYRSTIIYKSNTKLIINNSKATNISAALVTLENYENIYLILGGIAKEDGFDQFKKFKKNINQIYIFGKSRSLINKQLNLLKISKIFNNLNQVINCIWKDISLNDKKSTIIFAPACASFDQFKNFEQRGSYFNQLISKKIK